MAAALTRTLCARTTVPSASRRFLTTIRSPSERTSPASFRFVFTDVPGRGMCVFVPAGAGECYRGSERNSSDNPRGRSRSSTLVPVFPAKCLSRHALRRADRVATAHSLGARVETAVTASLWTAFLPRPTDRERLRAFRCWRCVPTHSPRSSATRRFRRRRNTGKDDSRDNLPRQIGPRSGPTSNR